MHHGSLGGQSDDSQELSVHWTGPHGSDIKMALELEMMGLLRAEARGIMVP